MTGIFYGSTTGNTEDLAGQIAEKLGIETANVYNVGNTSANEAEAYDSLLLGSSTWGAGDLQDDWYDFIASLKKRDLKGKKVALFGCGDSSSYPDTFCDAMGLIKEELAATGCVFIGEMSAAGYSETDSKAFDDGKALGLIADDDEPNLTAGRLANWIEIIKPLI